MKYLVCTQTWKKLQSNEYFYHRLPHSKTVLDFLHDKSGQGKITLSFQWAWLYPQQILVGVINSVARGIASQILEQKGPVGGVCWQLPIATAGDFCFLFSLCPWRERSTVEWQNRKMALIQDPNWEDLPLLSLQPREVGTPSLMRKGRRGPIRQEEASERGQGAGQGGLSPALSGFCAKRSCGVRVGKQNGSLENRVDNGHTLLGDKVTGQRLKKLPLEINKKILLSKKHSHLSFSLRLWSLEGHFTGSRIQALAPHGDGGQQTSVFFSFFLLDQGPYH